MVPINHWNHFKYPPKIDDCRVLLTFRTPSERPRAEEILGHPFLQTGDIESNAS